MRKFFVHSAFILFFFLIQINSARAGHDLPIDQIKLPPGFKIEVYARNVPNARSLTISDKGTVFVGSRATGSVYALVDENKDSKIDKIYPIGKNLNSPVGVAVRDGALYVAELDELIRFDDIENHLADPPQPVVIRQFPKDTWHGWKFIRFGPDGKLYVPQGSPCNVCETPDLYGTISKMNPDGSKSEIFARGIRNTVGFDWDPATKELWFTDNGRDELGDNSPPDELNHAPKQGLHFGFPYCHGIGIIDPKFGSKDSCALFTPPAQELGPHVASLGMRFYTGTMFPEEYRNQIFIAEHGSWNRSKKIGYRVSLVKLTNPNNESDSARQAISYEPFAQGWLEDDEAWGRPVDIAIMVDGSMLVSDDFASVIYRISYQAPAKIN